jgi:sterol carrier protein 2
VDCALALGFERMAPGSLKSNWDDREPPMALLSSISRSTEEDNRKNFGPSAPRMFSNGAQEYFDKYGGDITHLAKIGARGSTFVSIRYLW